MVKWLHHLLNPHCEECRDEQRESAVCPTCETLRSLLESEKFEKKQLLESILEFNKPHFEVAQTKEREEIKPKIVPWRVKQQLLEQEDRVKAQLIAEKQREMKPVLKVEVEDLEKELDIQGEKTNATISSS